MSDFVVFDALRERFSFPEWAYFEEVRNGTGFARTARTADGLAMSLWPSRGLELNGIEVKSSRQDWVREKNDPAKAEEIFRFCDRWWLAVADESIVQEGELPPTWGLLVPRGKKLVCRVEAPKLTPEPLSRLFLASILKRAATRTADEVKIQAEVEKRVAAEKERWEANRTYDSRRQSELYDDLRREVFAFQEASGIRINEYHGGKELGDAVRAVRAGEHLNVRMQLEHMLGQAERIANSIRAELKPAHKPEAA